MKKFSPTPFLKTIGLKRRTVYANYVRKLHYFYLSAQNFLNMGENIFSKKSHAFEFIGLFLYRHAKSHMILRFVTVKSSFNFFLYQRPPHEER